MNSSSSGHFRALWDTEYHCFNTCDYKCHFICEVSYRKWKFTKVTTLEDKLPESSVICQWGQCRHLVLHHHFSVLASAGDA